MARFSLGVTMHKFLLLSVSPMALFAAAAPSAAQTVSSNTSSNLATGGSDVTINSGVTVSPAAGAAVTVNSNNTVTNNGTITFNGVNDSAGIVASGGLAGSITNAGTITDSETSTASDTDGDGDNDTPLANGSGRYGIHVVGTGTGAPFTGTVTNSGTITVVGNNSAGIAIDAPLTGSLVSSGAVSVIGSDSYAIHTGAVSGDVTISGATSAQGENAVGVAIDGDVGGALTVSSSITATGFRDSGALYTYPDADDLLIGGPGLAVAGSVGGGISIDSAGSVISYGSAPAVQIGAASGTTIGLVADTTYGLSIAGAVTGSGINAGVDAQAIRIGDEGGTVAIAGGISIAGTVSAVANQANALGLELASGTSTPTLNVSGTLSSTGGVGTFASRALVIDAGASVPSLVNSGTIAAYNSGSAGTSAAIQDLSGTLASITNTGTIAASLTGTYAATQYTAIDLSANTSGVTIAQSASTVSGAVLPTIVGQVITGSGNDSLTLTAGSLTGAVSLGAGNDTVSLASAQLVGNVDFGSGVGTLALSGSAALTGDVTLGAGSSITLADTASFTGTLVQNGNPVALTIAGGSFVPTTTGAVALSSLSVGSTGVLGVHLDPATASGTLYTVSGGANFTSGASVALTIASLVTEPQSYTIIQAGSLTGASNLTLTTADLPYLYQAALTTDATAGTVGVTIGAKTAAELGLNRSGTAAYSAIYAAIPADSAVTAAFIAATDAASFAHIYGEMLPEHAGGTFLAAADISRGAAAFMASDSAPRSTSGGLSLWVGQLGNRASKDQGDTESYDLTSWGLAFGAEYKLGKFGTAGIGYDWSYNSVDNGDNANQVIGYLSEISGYWRGSWGGLHLSGRAAIGQVSYTSKRYLTNPVDDSDIVAQSAADWTGHTIAFDGGASYQLAVGRVYFRPTVQVDYFRLREDAHQETGGGDAFDLLLAKRTSDSLAGTYSLVTGYQLGRGETASRVELELGDRSRLNGSVGDTTASYAGGSTFTLQPDALRYGPLAAARFVVGNDFYGVSAELRAQKLEDYVATGFSVALKLNL